MNSLEVRIEGHKFIDKELSDIALSADEQIRLVTIYERHYNLRSHFGHDFATWEARRYMQPLILYLKEFYGGGRK